MIGLESLLNNLKYKEISAIAKEEGLPTKGKKKQLIKLLLEEMDPVKLRKKFSNLRGADFDLFQHNLVPPHEIVPKKEADAILEKYKVERGDLPKILDKDPAILAINAKPGDLIRIKRNSHTAGIHDYFRVVVTSITKN